MTKEAPKNEEYVVFCVKRHDDGKETSLCSIRDF